MQARPLTRSVSASPGNQEEQADAAALDDVADGVEAVVAAGVRDDEPGVVEHRDEAGGASARGHVAAALRIGGRDAARTANAR